MIRILTCLFVISLTNLVFAQNKAIQFNGSRYINITNGGSGSTLNFTTDSFTLEAWIKPKSFALGTNNYDHTILGNDSTSNTGAGYVLRTGGSRKLSFAYSYGSGWKEVITSSAVLDTNQWLHVAVTKQAGDIKLYLNGQIVATGFFATNNNIHSSTKTLKIGENGSINSRKFIGDLDEVKIWRAARSQAQIQYDMTEACNSFPTTLTAYYKLNDTGTATTNTIVCSTNTTLNGTINGAITSKTGAILYHGGSTILYVDSSNTSTICGLQNGYSWATAFSDLNTAIEVSQMHPLIEKIYVSKGTYHPKNFPYQMQANRTSRQLQSPNNLDKTFHIRTGLELYGGYPNGGGLANPSIYRTILDGSNAGGSTTDTACNVVFIDTAFQWNIPNDTTKLIGFTIRNGRANLNSYFNTSGGFGGGIYAYRGTHLIENCLIINNKSLNSGGGIYIKGARSTILNDTLANNGGSTISSGGGGIISSGSTTTIQNCYFTNNSGAAIGSEFSMTYIINNEITRSGGISQSNGSSFISGNYIHHNTGRGISIQYSNSSYIANNVISNHKTTGYGGGIFLYGGQNEVVNNIIQNDTAQYGGGIYSFSSYNTFSGNTLINNSATALGGGIWCQSGKVKLYKNVITKNISSMYGGGVYIDKGTDSTPIVGNIISGNTALLQGGGLFIDGNFTVANNVISENIAARTAGLYTNTWDSSLIVNNTFYNNLSTDTTNLYNSCALALGIKKARVFNNIFWKNRIGSSDTIRGVDFFGSSSNYIFNNNALQRSATSYSYGSGGYFDIGANASNNYFAINPMFANSGNIAGTDGIPGTQDDGLQLLNGSTLIDSGKNSLLPSSIIVDVKNQTRVYGSNIDVGAYEASCLPTNISSFSQINICKGTSTTLQVNSTSPYQNIKWYADSLSTTIIDTGYYYNTSVLNNTDTFWVSALNCSSNAKIPVQVIVHSPYSIQNITACDSLFWPQTNKFYTMSGSYTDTLISSLGCDSITTLNLTILKTTDSSTPNIMACDSFFWAQTNKFYTTSGSYTDTLINSLGCDSIVTINLNILNTPTATIAQNGLTLQANPSASSYQWLMCNPYQIIPNETALTYNVSSNGTYAVVITQNGCVDTSDCITMTGLSLEEYKTQSQVIINPNPTNGLTTIKLSNEFKNGMLYIRNTLGVIIYKSAIQSPSLIIDLSKDAAGLYYIIISKNDVLHTIKFIKQ